MSESFLSNGILSLGFEGGRWVSLKELASGAELISGPGAAFDIKADFDGRAVTNYGFPGVQSSASPIVPAGEWIGAAEKFEDAEYFENDGFTGIKMKYSLAGGWSAEINFMLSKSAPEIEREIELRYDGPREGFLRELMLGGPRFRIGADEENILEIYDTRNNFANLRRPLGSKLEEFPGDRIPGKEHRLSAMDCDCHHECSMLLHSPASRLSLFSWSFSSDLEAVCYSFDENKGGIAFNHHWFAFAKIRKGMTVKCRRQIIGVIGGGWKDAVSEIEKLKRRAGWAAPGAAPELKKTFLYQAHGFLMDCGGFNGLTERLDGIKDLGAGIIYLPPLAPPEAYLNYLPDAVSPSYGTDEEFASLVKSAHARGMKIILDMIAHHIYEESPALANKDFTRYDERGAPLVYSIGARVTETANPDYIDYYVKCCENLVKKYDIDGFRFDVAGFQLPNWSETPAFCERPGMGVLAQTRLLQEIKKRLEKIKPLIFLEEGMGVNGFRYVSHGWIRFIKFLRSQEASKPEKLGAILKKLGYLLEDRALKERPGCVTAYHFKIHDTALLQSFGLAIDGPDKALAGLCFAADGVPFITMGAERGSRALIKNLAEIRRNIRELWDGAYDFSLASCSASEVFCFARTNAKSRSIVMINFSARELSAKLEIPAGAWNTVFSGEKIRCERLEDEALSFKPFEIKIISETKIKAPAEKKVSKQPASSSAEWRTSQCKDDNCLAFENGRFSVSFDLKTGAIKSAEDSSGKLALDKISLFARESAYESARIPEELKIDADEGSFSGSFTAAKADGARLFKNDAWAAPDFDDSKWPAVFVPSTKEPYFFCGKNEGRLYIEDIIPGEFEALWSRAPNMRSGASYYRRVFSAGAKPEKAKLKICAPVLYDFDLTRDSCGLSSALTKQFNKVRVFINGAEISVPQGEASWTQGADISGRVLPGRNIIAVQVERGFGSRGFAAKLSLGGEREEIISSDAEWRCAPPAAWTPQILEYSLEHSAPKRPAALKFSAAIANTRILTEYRFSSSGGLSVSIAPDAKYINPRANFSLKLHYNFTVRSAEAWEALQTNGETYGGGANDWQAARNSYSGALVPLCSSRELRFSKSAEARYRSGPGVLCFSHLQDAETNIFGGEELAHCVSKNLNGALTFDINFYNGGIL